MFQTMSTLKDHPVYQKLTKAQAQLDLIDPILNQMPMTRSPQHILAYLVTWALTEQSKKNIVVDQLNNLLKQQNVGTITIEELDTLTNNINWDELFGDLATQNNTPDVFKLQIPADLYQHIQSQANSPSLYQALKKHKMTVNGNNPSTVVILTKVMQQTEWLTPFKKTVSPTGQSLWYVDENTFALGDEFKSELQKLRSQCIEQAKLDPKAKVTQHFGSFSVTTSLQGSLGEHTADSYLLRIDPKGQEALSVHVKQTDIRPGLYASFIDASLAGLPKPIESVCVKLEGDAKLDPIGASVTQKQEVHYNDMMGSPSSNNTQYVSFDILVNDVHAHFKHTEIAVDFSPKQTIQDGVIASPHLLIGLKDRQGKIAVELSSIKLTSSIQAAIDPQPIQFPLPINQPNHSFLLDILAHPAAKVVSAVLTLAGLACLTIGTCGLAGAAIGLPFLVSAILTGLGSITASVSGLGFFKSMQMSPKGHPATSELAHASATP